MKSGGGSDIMDGDGTDNADHGLWRTTRIAGNIVFLWGRYERTVEL